MFEVDVKVNTHIHQKIIVQVKYKCKMAVSFKNDCSIVTEVSYMM